jgi:hypothetical protein
VKTIPMSERDAAVDHLLIHLHFTLTHPIPQQPLLQQPSHSRVAHHPPSDFWTRFYSFFLTTSGMAFSLIWVSYACMAFDEINIVRYGE